MVPQSAVASPRPQKPRKSSRTLQWEVPADLIASPAVAYRNSFARALAAKPVDEIVTSYVYLSRAQMAELVDSACNHFRVELSGIGVEVGSGCGLLAATIARLKTVSHVYAVEVCEGMVKSVMPKVTAAVLGNDARKVTCTFGSFDNLELADKSMDFIVEIDSLHHSDDLSRTLKECYRVMKPGGKMLCFDRCHPDSLSDEDVEKMLAKVYSADFLRKNHYPPDITLTRRDNGEHELRLREWKSAFRSAGLELTGIAQFVQKVRFAMAVKGLLSVLPRPLTALVYRSNNADWRSTRDWALQYVRPVSPKPEFGRMVLAPKSSTVFLLTKPVQR